MHTEITSPPARRIRQCSRARTSHRVGFYLVVYAFIVVMAFSAVPTPLYVVYAARDHFSALTGTFVFAAYVVGVVASLIFAGHISDWYGRRRILLPATACSAVAGLIFIVSPSLVALIVARVVSGVAVGMVTTTATAHLGELHRRSRPDTSPRRAQLVAIAANLGGIGTGPLLAGLLAQFAPRPLVTPYLVFEALLLVAIGALACTPETVTAATGRIEYRPQRIVVPEEARRRFFAAASGGFTVFAVFGLFSAVAPGILAGTLHAPSHALAGAVAFAVFGAAALAQLALFSLSSRAAIAIGTPLVPVGLAVLVGAAYTGELPTFLIGAIIVGAGAGLVFKGALATAVSLAPPHARAEVLAGFFLASYVGLAIPVVLLGFIGELVAAWIVLAGFGAVVTALIVPSALSLGSKANDGTQAQSPSATAPPKAA